MAELRKVRIEEIKKNVLGFEPDIPSNWYVPAKQTWNYLMWCLVQIRHNNTFRNDKDMMYCMDNFADWIEDYAITFGEEHEDGTAESNS